MPHVAADNFHRPEAVVQVWVIYSLSLDCSANDSLHVMVNLAVLGPSKYNWWNYLGHDIPYIPQQCTGVALAQCSLKKCRRLVQVNTEWTWSVHSREVWSSWTEKDSIKVDWKSFHKKPLKEQSLINVKEFRKLTSKTPTTWRKCLKKAAFLKTMLSYKVKTHIYFHQGKKFCLCLPGYYQHHTSASVHIDWT